MANTSTASGFNEVFKNSPFFTAGETTFGKQLKLKNKTPIIDVYSKLPWRSQNGPNPAELEIPYIMLTEYEINLSKMLANINTFIAEIQAKGLDTFTDVYKKLYIANPTGFIYKLPWLIGQGTTLMGANNNWSDGNTTNPFDGLGDMISNLMPSDAKKNPKASKAAGVGKWLGSTAANVAKGLMPGVNGLDTVSYFEGADKKAINVSFPLYNTLDHKSAFENYNFVLLLTFQNTMTRTSLFTHIPPKIYEMRTAVGGTFMAAAYISNLNVTNIGTTRLLPASEFGHISEAILIPEAYRISFTITDLLPPSTQLLASSNGNSPVSVIRADAFNGSEILNNIGSGFSSVINAIKAPFQ
jgi:hypothetical protein